MEAQLLAPRDKPPRTYRTRWRLLALASLIAGGQGGIWLTYGVIAQAVMPLFGWDVGTIALLNNWGPIGFLLAAYPTSWLLDVCGLRSTAIVGATLVLSGGVARCVHYSTDGVGSALAHAGQLLNGLAGPIAMSIGPVLSAVWFPPEERALATAVVATANYGGTAVIFWLGSVCVPADVEDEERVHRAYWRFMLGEACYGAALLAACVLSFASKPPSAPSRTAAIAREAPLEGIRRLGGCRPFWVLALSYGATSGVFQGWGSLLGNNMQGVLPQDEAEAQAGLLGCCGAVAGILGGIGLGIAADRWRARAGRRKRMLIGCCVCAALAFAAFALLCDRRLLRTMHASTRLACMYVTSIIGSLLSNASIPLYFEMAVEATYPAAEGLTTSSLTLLQNLPLLGFYLVPEALPAHSSADVSALMNWAVVAACAFGAAVLLPLTEQRRRLAVDAEEATPCEAYLPALAAVPVTAGTDP